MLEIAEVAEPAPGFGEVLVRVRATALNRADLLQRRGRYAPPPGVTWAEIHLLATFLFLCFMALATYMQWINIRANQEVIARIVEYVRAARAAKGLE